MSATTAPACHWKLRGFFGAKTGAKGGKGPTSSHQKARKLTLFFCLKGTPGAKSLKQSLEAKIPPPPVAHKKTDRKKVIKKKKKKKKTSSWSFCIQSNAACYLPGDRQFLDGFTQLLHHTSDGGLWEKGEHRKLFLFSSSQFFNNTFL